MTHSPEDRALLAEFRHREAALHSLENYVHYMKPTGLQCFQHAPQNHHLAMYDTLHKITRNEIRNATISAPPGSAKSFTAALIWLTFMLARNPQLKIIYVTSSDELSLFMNRIRREICRSPQWQSLSAAELKKDASSATLFETTRNGSILATTIGSSVIGQRADIVLVDDAIKGQAEAANLVLLQNHKQWFDLDLRTRLRQNGHILIIATRWSRFDLIGQVQEEIEEGLEPREDWDFLSIPLQCDDPETDPLHRAQGELIYPELYQPQLARLQADPEAFAALYQQQPLASSSEWCPPDCIQITATMPHDEDMTLFIAGDLALGTATGDWTVLGVFGMDFEGYLYILDWWRERKPLNEVADQLRAWASLYNPKVIMLDDDHMARAMQQQHQSDRTIGPLIRPLPTLGRSKLERAATAQSLLRQKRVFIKEARWNKDLTREIVQFPDVRFDDQVDCLAVAARTMTRLPRPANTRAIQQGRQHPMAVRYYEGRLHTQATLGEMMLDRDTAINQTNRFTRERI